MNMNTKESTAPREKRSRKRPPEAGRTEEIVYCRQLRDMYADRLRSLGRAKSTVSAFLLSWRYVVEDGGALTIEDITVEKTREFADRLKAKGTRGQTINYYINFVKDALDWARSFEYIRQNPLARWEPVRRDAPTALLW